jgi:hypothetical protein
MFDKNGELVSGTDNNENEGGFLKHVQMPDS